MIRKINDKNAEIIKKMLSKNYRTSSIIDEMQIKHGVTITAYDINNIKKGTAYCDIRPELNEVISKKYVSSIEDNELIKDIKYLLAEGFSESEIIMEYNISKKKLMGIRLGYSPYDLIAPEYNKQISLLNGRRKNMNINEKIVLSIKKEYVIKNGQISYAELATNHNIDKATVSNILTFKSYEQYGSSYNLKITRIKNKTERLISTKKEIIRKKKIKTHNQKINSYMLQIDLINAKISESKRMVQSLK